jgi:hypothetical protein
VAAGVVVLVGLLLAARPWWATARQVLDNPGTEFVARLQESEALARDGTRTYAERSLEWVWWYTGAGALVAAWLALAELARRGVRAWRPGGEVPPWLAAAAVGFGSSVLTLYRPGITPDHPWADRRLVPVVLPLVAIAATGAAAWCARRARRRLPATLLVAVIVVALAVLLVPPAVATAPVAGRRTEVGEPGAVAAVCSALRPGDVVLAVDGAPDGRDGRSANEWPQLVRGVCGHPAGALLTPAVDLPAAVARLGRLVSAAGGRLVLLAAGDAPPPDVLLAGLAGPARHVVHLETFEDRRLLTQRPAGVDRLVIDVWLADSRPPADG